MLARQWRSSPHQWQRIRVTTSYYYGKVALHP